MAEPTNENKQDMFRCPLCLDVFANQIVECPECFEVFCFPCVMRAFNENPTCPLCRKKTSPPPTWHRNLAIERRVGNLTLECENRKHGCNVSVTRFTKTEHELACEFAQIKCKLGCGATCARKDLEAHERELCTLRLLACSQQCGETVKASEMDTHISTACANTLVDCTNSCGHEQIKRGDLARHIAECPLQVVDCVFKPEGCEERVLRRDFDKHVESASHMRFVALGVRRLAGEITALGTENEKLRKEINVINTTQGAVVTTLNMLCLKIGVPAALPPNSLSLAPSAPTNNTNPNNNANEATTSTTAVSTTSDQTTPTTQQDDSQLIFRVGDCVRIDNAGHLYPTVGRIPDHSGLESWPSEDIKRLSINTNWKRRHVLGDVGVVVHVTRHALARNDVAVVKIENDYVCVDFTGLSHIDDRQI